MSERSLYCLKHWDLEPVCYCSGTQPVLTDTVILCRQLYSCQHPRSFLKALGISGKFKCLKAKQNQKLPLRKVKSCSICPFSFLLGGLVREVGRQP
jgi:hypothetical protein